MGWDMSAGGGDALTIDAAWSRLLAGSAAREPALSVVGQLAARGLAVTTAEELLGNRLAFAALRRHVDGVAAVDLRVSLAGNQLEPRRCDPLLRFMLHPQLLAVPSHHHRMPARLLECAVARTATTEAPPEGAPVLTCVVYLEDADEIAPPGSCTAPAGTILFADQAGLDVLGRSGLADRLVVTARYGSAAALRALRFPARPRVLSRSS